MREDAIRALMALPLDQRAWPKGAANTMRVREAFISIDSGQELQETIENWNRVVDPRWAVKATTENVPTPGGYKSTLVCNGRFREVFYEGSRADCLLDALALNAVARPDIELRLLKDSAGNSDLCYLPLAPNEWTDVETTYGNELVSLKFEPLPSTLGEFELTLAVLAQPDPVLQQRVVDSLLRQQAIRANRGYFQ